MTDSVHTQNIRTDLRRIQDWIEPQSRLLDLACGDGTLLALLAESKNTTGYGMEISQPDIRACLAKGLNVIHRDIELGLDNFDDRSFDYVLTDGQSRCTGNCVFSKYGLLDQQALNWCAWQNAPYPFITTPVARHTQYALMYAS